jgi:hypothetical protein
VDAPLSGEIEEGSAPVEWTAALGTADDGQREAGDEEDREHRPAYRRDGMADEPRSEKEPGGEQQ